MEHSPRRSVTEEERSQKPTLAQPPGWPSFLPLPSLLAPYPDTSGKGMLVARAWAVPKIPGHAGVEIYLSQYLIEPVARRVCRERSEDSILFRKPSFTNASDCRLPGNIFAMRGSSRFPGAHRPV
jgi:hypothetical protein